MRRIETEARSRALNPEIMSAPEERVSAKVEHCLTKAAECERLAEAAKDFRAKEMFKEAARQWREMAAQAERLGW